MLNNKIVSNDFKDFLKHGSLLYAVLIEGIILPSIVVIIIEYVAFIRNSTFITGIFLGLLSFCGFCR
ncbi:MAG: hypothetical protein LBI63_04730 [Candidatus Ancillula sp.]|nr:hypothetical protein [Candidatus Ancillula sp.]